MNQLMRFSRLHGDSKVAPFVAILVVLTLLASMGNLLMPEDSAFYVSTYTITLLGKYLCYAMLALAVDVIWGYCGILSLGHGAFFALGGYAMGCDVDGVIGAGHLSLYLWLVSLPFTCNGCVSFHYDPSPNVCTVTGLLP